MRTAKQILNEHHSGVYINEDIVVQAMEAYAQQSRESKPIELPTDEEIKQAGHEWKTVLGMNAFRLESHLDFQAGATWMRDEIAKQLKP